MSGIISPIGVLNPNVGIFSRNGVFTSGGIFGGGGDSPIYPPIVISAPDGAYTGATLNVTGGTPSRVNVGEEPTDFNGDVWVVVIYQFVIDGSPVGEWFTVVPTTIPTVTVGQTIQVQDREGNISNTLIAINPPIPVPVNTSPPTIDPTSGGDGTLVQMLSEGSWTPTPDSFEYRWTLNGNPIPGAVLDSYTVPASTTGDIYRIQVRARITGGDWSNWINSNYFTYEDTPISWDTDALLYIEQVEDDDGEALEMGVRLAINDLFIDLKNAAAPLGGTNWDSVESGSFIIPGARTLEGSLNPLSPTFAKPVVTNIVSGDYNRKTGWVGASGKRVNYPDMSTGGPSQNDHAFGAWVANFGVAGTNRAILSCEASSAANGGLIKGTGTTFTFYSASSSGSNITTIEETDFGLYGLSRHSSTEFVRYAEGLTSTAAVTSTVFSASTARLFQRSNNTLQFTGRISAGYIIKSVDQTAMNTALTKYLNALNALTI